MSEKRYTVGLQSKTIFDMKTELYLFDNKIICELLNAQNSLICEQQTTINKLRKILAEAEDTIEVRLAEHYLKEYENIKHNIIGDNDGCSME